MRLQETLAELDKELRQQLWQVDAKEREGEEHLKSMQRAVLADIDNLKHEVSEGRRKIADEIEKGDMLRKEAIASMKNDFFMLKEQLEQRE